MIRTIALHFFTCALCLCAPVAALAVTIPTVPVGNAGNANDPSTGNVHGGVAYRYEIGATEVTNSQYAEFLNAKAASDPLGLYQPLMAISNSGGITRSGASGSYTYSLKPNMGNKPVTHVSGYDSIRFANWLHNGQGAGDTETGAYTLLGGTPVPSNGDTITRNVGAKWFLPNENEWYKAAFYQPALQGGDADNYWLYPTRSNTAPTIATAIDLLGPTRGDIGNPGANVANYRNGANWNFQSGNVTTVGSAGPLSQSYYGTSDQGGNVFEWIEKSSSGSGATLRGGSYVSSSGSGLNSSSAGASPWDIEFSNAGFRIATVPEPGTFCLAAFAGLALLAIRRRRG